MRRDAGHPCIHVYHQTVVHSPACAVHVRVSDIARHALDASRGTPSVPLDDNKHPVAAPPSEWSIPLVARVSRPAGAQTDETLRLVYDADPSIITSTQCCSDVASTAASDAFGRTSAVLLGCLTRLESSMTVHFWSRYVCLGITSRGAAIAYSSEFCNVRPSTSTLFLHIPN